MRGFLVAFSVLALAGSSSAQPQDKPVSGKRAAAKPETGVKREGIQVHGHWTVQVSNPDGKVVTRREFENSLTPPSQYTLGGGYVLESILLGLYVPQSYVIGLQGNPSPCVNGLGCNIDESFAAAVGCNPSNVFCTLTRSPAVGSLPATGTVPMTFQGSFTAYQSGNINSVTLGLIVCANSGAVLAGQLSPTSPAVCLAANSNIPTVSIYYSTGYENLTSTTLSTPVQVTAGQIVNAAVAISFQ